MKFLKWLLYIVLAIAALILIIPLFLPAEVNVGTTIEVTASPEEVFQVAATFTDRGLWDPWLESDSTSSWETVPSDQYVGSTYSWKGDRIGTGRMRIDSVAYGRHIWASIWFGPDPNPSQVEWVLEPVGTGTLINWKFHTSAGYPIGRIMMNLMKGSLQESFERGMRNFNDYITANPPVLSLLSPITEGTMPAMYAMVAMGEGTMEEMEDQMMVLYNKVLASIQNQGLQISGPPFSQYLEYDAGTNTTTFLAGFQVSSPGVAEGDVLARSYPAVKVMQAVHSGPYNQLYLSYDAFSMYFRENGITPKGQAFEFYYNNPMEVKDVTKLKTLIAFPI